MVRRPVWPPCGPRCCRVAGAARSLWLSPWCLDHFPMFQGRSILSTHYRDSPEPQGSHSEDGVELAGKIHPPWEAGGGKECCVWAHLGWPRRLLEVVSGLERQMGDHSLGLARGRVPDAPGGPDDFYRTLSPTPSQASSPRVCTTFSTKQVFYHFQGLMHAASGGWPGERSSVRGEVVAGISACQGRATEEWQPRPGSAVSTNRTWGEHRAEPSAPGRPDLPAQGPLGLQGSILQTLTCCGLCC